MEYSIPPVVHCGGGRAVASHEIAGLITVVSCCCCFNAWGSDRLGRCRGPRRSLGAYFLDTPLPVAVGRLRPLLVVERREVWETGRLSAI
eukprot:1850357-Pyramimonas_sp.AAC.1